jgi:hypothetical protein
VLQDSIVAGNSASGNPNLPSPAHHRDVFVGAGASLSAKFSLIQNDTDGLALDTTDITGKDPLLGPLPTLQGNIAANFQLAIDRIGGQTIGGLPPAKPDADEDLSATRRSTSRSRAS